MSAWLLFLAIVALAPRPALAQINLSATAGTPAASYTTLKGAFDAINAGTHQGAIAISVTGNTTELATAVLAASGSGAATYSGVVITPRGGATRVIGGSLDAPLIDLDGADNVTINGLNSGGNALILTNLNTGAAALTLRFINDASNNNISNAALSGSGTDNTRCRLVLHWHGYRQRQQLSVQLQHCSAAGGTPTNGVVSIGSAAPAENSGNTIGNCDVANFFNASTATVGILIGSGNTQWTVNNNRLFQSVPRTYTTANVHSGIQIASGADHIISGNRIGFSSGAGTGVYTMLGTIATRLIAIDINLTAAAPVSVQGNTVSGISLATSSGATTTFGVLCGINITGGSASVGTVTPNIIGGASGVDLLTVTSLTSGALLAGIHTSSPDAVTIQNNTIGGLSSSGTTATVAGSVTGINVSGSTASLTIIGNTARQPKRQQLARWYQWLYHRKFTGIGNQFRYCLAVRNSQCCKQHR
ncbi:MAG: hypothetical protein IPK97_21370 [Ahniella sp.]|nr:hypothetical protein [Ahniella sp.]